MKEQLSKALKRNQLVDMIYVSKSNEITKRRVKLIKLTDNSFHAFCFNRNAKRTFAIDNVLAIVPVYSERVS